MCSGFYAYKIALKRYKSYGRTHIVKDREGTSQGVQKRLFTYPLTERLNGVGKKVGIEFPCYNETRARQSHLL